MNDSNLSLHTSEDSDIWDNLILHSPQSNPFALSNWLNIFSEIFKTPFQFISRYQNQEVLSGALIFPRKKRPYIVSTQIPVGLYTGIFFHQQTWSSILDDKKNFNLYLENLLNDIENRVQYYSTTLHPTISNFELTLNSKWKIKKQNTIILDITSADNCWNNFNQSLRRKIRRALDKKIEIVQSMNTEILIEQHVQSYKRQNIEPPINKNILKKWLDRLSNENLIQIYYAKCGDTCLASRAIVLHQKTVYDFLAGINTSVNTQNASHLIIWKLIEMMSPNGYCSFDFMGANTPGPTEFKKSFGGKIVPYFQLTYYHSNTIRSLEHVRNFMIQKQRRLK